ncbi:MULTISPECIES: FAD-dependent monooxygenase [unclassified Streptomyces]|uniref:FAD-dependent monooxygenase n=1 Tax=unclassified Streptomyces TaxID=2593676 RepID=UPI0003665077|nr:MULTISPECIES: FAD-dependent monooxygenase [unclassified Streptomyces]MYT33066.1 FAD-binding monooxygenase [Streptomyces sp. SID8354]
MSAKRDVGPVDVPVLVVGAGPVGLSTGMFLAHWGVRPLVVDKRPDAMEAVPRASTSLRTLELFRSVGLEPVLEREGWEGGLPMRTVFKESGLGATLHHGGLPSRYAALVENCSPVPPRRVLTHDQVQRVAWAELRRQGGEVRFGVRLVGLTADDDQVRARLVDVDTGDEREVTARCLIGADGANSEVRGRLGITMPDRTAIGHLHTAFYRADLGRVQDDWGTHVCFVRNDAVYATLMSKNGRDQWASHILDHPGKPQDGPSELSEDATLALLRAAIGDATIPIELHAVNAWEAAVGMASAFRRGRVFLAGDAAHVQSSAGGLGMNTGIQDGHNLAWKLAAVLRGRCAPTLLDSYEPERRAAARASLALSRNLLQGYQSLDGDPNALYEKLAVDYLRGMMFYGYPPHGAEGAGDVGAAVDVTGEAVGAEAAWPDPLDDAVHLGHRFPHRWVDSPPSDRMSTLDLIGSHWTLFTAGDLPRWRAAAASSLGTTCHAVHELDAPQAAELAMGDDAVLVRPDGFVAWRGTTEDSLRAALCGWR